MQTSRAYRSFPCGLLTYAAVRLLIYTSRCAPQVVMEDEALRSEAEAMHADGRKLELEALHTLGLDFFTLFLRDKIMRSA